MRAQALLQQQLAGYHDVLEQTIADCQRETLDKNLPGATITCAGSIYAHCVFSEDEILHGMLQGRPGLYRAQSWAGRTGVEPPSTPDFAPDWGRTVKMNLPAFREYAKAVYGATDAYIAALSDADLERKVETGFIGRADGRLRGVEHPGLARRRAHR